MSNPTTKPDEAPALARMRKLPLHQFVELQAANSWTGDGMYVMRVPGGFIYQHDDCERPVSMVFVPDFGG